MSAAGARGHVVLCCWGWLLGDGDAALELQAALGQRACPGVTAWKRDAEGEEVVSMHRDAAVAVL